MTDGAARWAQGYIMVPLHGGGAIQVEFLRRCVPADFLGSASRELHNGAGIGNSR